jgi:hypothetical protein
MRRLVPAVGAGFSLSIVATTRQVTSLGPFAAGVFIERVVVTIHLRTQTATTALRLAFALGAAPSEVVGGFLSNAPILDTADPVQPGRFWHRWELGAGQTVRFVFFPGVVVGGGATWLLVYHDLEDGTDAYNLVVSVRTLRDVGMAAAELGKGGVVP